MSEDVSIGLGEPEDASKHSLFRPPAITPVQEKIENQTAARKPAKPNHRHQPKLRTSVELTPRALVIIQGIQQEYRLQYGKSLPLWKAICELIEHKGKSFRVP